MTTEHKDRHTFPSISLTSQYTLSHTGQVVDYSGYSLTGGFADRRQLSPTADVGQIREVLATLIKDLLAPKS